MKYPGLPPVGADGPESAWTRAGRDLPAAVDLLTREFHRKATAVAGVKLIEALRRKGDWSRAQGTVARLDAIATSTNDRALTHFSVGTLRWTAGDALGAREAYERALVGWTELGDAVGTAAATVGLARSLRLTVHESGPQTATQGYDLAQRCADAHVLADAARELSAWALLRGDHDAAAHHAREALEIHEGGSDTYLVGSAQILLARAWHATGNRDDGVTMMRDVVASARDIGSVDLELTASIFLGQFLQQGVTPDHPSWNEAVALLSEALDRAEDPVTRAEILLPLAHLWTASNQLEQAAAAVDEYEQMYLLVGGNRIAMANIAKARARLALADGGQFQYGAFATLRLGREGLRARRLFKKAERLYKTADLQTGAASVRWHRDLLATLMSGRPQGRSAARLPWVKGDDPLIAARIAFVAGEQARLSGRPNVASDRFAEAETLARSCGATQLAVGAAARGAETAYAQRDFATAAASARRAVRYTDAIRGAVADGHARGTFARTIRAHYERAATLAARMGQPELTIEVLERLRTERLAGLVHQRGVDDMPADLRSLLDQLDELNEEIAQSQGSAGLVRSALARAPARRPAETSELEGRRETLRDTLRERTNALFAHVYDANMLDTDALFNALTTHLLTVCPVTGVDGDELVAAWRAPDGRGGTATVSVAEDVAHLRDVLTRGGLEGTYGRIQLTWQSLGCLTPLLPAGFRDELREANAPVQVLLVVSGWLWQVPFAAIPLGTATGPPLLVDRSDLVYAPSLRVHHLLEQRQHNDRARGRSAVSFGDPALEASELAGLDAFAAHTTLRDSGEVADAFVHGGDRWDLGVLAAHGDTEAGLAQGVFTEDGTRILTAADFLRKDAAPPTELSFAICHGAAAFGPDPHEPLGLTLAALSAGARAVLSTHFELESGLEVANGCLERLYSALADPARVPGRSTGLRSVAQQLAMLQRQPVLRTHPLARWAVLCVVGTTRSDGDWGARSS